MPGKMPPENLHKMYDNSIESSVVSSKSGNTPNKVRTPNQREIVKKEKLEVIDDEGTGKNLVVDASNPNFIKSRNSTGESFVHVDKEYKTQEKQDSINYLKHENQERKFNTVGDKGFNMETEEKTTLKQKKSKIEVNLDFDSMKKMPSKRTILSKNKGSTKSFNSLMIRENDQISRKLRMIKALDENEVKRSITQLKFNPKVPNKQNIKKVEDLQVLDSKENEEDEEEKKSIFHKLIFR